jgi:LmbE family N-acetylglucosaminyl deacetylase
MTITSPTEVARLAAVDTEAFLRTVRVGGFFAHPDDTELEGGALLVGLARIVEVHVLLAATGQAGIPGVEPDEVGAIRWAEAWEAGRVLGARSIETLDMIDGEVVGGPDLERKLVKWCEKLGITHLVTHHPKCYNEDHRVVAKAANDAQRRCPLNRPRLASVDTLTGADSGDPPVSVDVSRWMGRAMEAFAQHVTQRGDGRLEHGARTVAAVRGLQRDDSCAYAAGIWGRGVYPQIAVADFARLGQLANLVPDGK